MENSTTNYQKQDNGDVDASTYSAAQKYYEDGNYETAAKLFLGLLNKKASSDLYSDIGSCYYMMERYKEAVEFWEKAIEFDPTNSNGYANLGNLYYKRKNVDKAISYWVGAIVLKPEDATTCLNLAVAFSSKNMRLEAIKYYEKFLKYSEDKSTKEYNEIKNNIENYKKISATMIQYGIELKEKKDEKRAAECFLRALSAYPSSVVANMNLGTFFYNEKIWEKAFKYWKNALYIEPNQPKLLLNVALCCDMLKYFDYAYCYYYRYMNFIISDKNEYYKINQRLMKIKVFLNKNPQFVEKHLNLAKEYLANHQFYCALDEFKNHALLDFENKNEYRDLMKQIETYIEPEIAIIQNCFKYGNRLISEFKYKEAKNYYARILVLSSPEYIEFQQAKNKFALCVMKEKG